MEHVAKNQTEGVFIERRSKSNKIAGKLSDNPTMEAGSIGEKTTGNAQEKFGQAQKVLGESNGSDGPCADAYCDLRW